MTIEPRLIAVDFDGTIVRHRFPHIGPPVPHAVGVLRRLHDTGHRLILWTCRTGQDLEDAAQTVLGLGVPLHGVNANAETDPGVFGFKSRPKVYAHIYIVDAALGCPLSRPRGEPPYVNWLRVARMLEARGILREIPQPREKP